MNILKKILPILFISILLSCSSDDDGPEEVKKGTEDFNTVEGIVIDRDNSEKVLLIHGEPDNKLTGTDSNQNPTETLTYLSKGFEVFTVSNIVTSIRLFNFWSREIEGNRVAGTPYKNSIKGLNFSNNFTLKDVENILNKPTSILKSSNGNSDLKWYHYNDANSIIDGAQGADFYFNSDKTSDKTEDFENEKVLFVILF